MRQVVVNAVTWGETVEEDLSPSGYLLEGQGPRKNASRLRAESPQRRAWWVVALCGLRVPREGIVFLQLRGPH